MAIFNHTCYGPPDEMDVNLPTRPPGAQYIYSPTNECAAEVGQNPKIVDTLKDLCLDSTHAHLARALLNTDLEIRALDKCFRWPPLFYYLWENLPHVLAQQLINEYFACDRHFHLCRPFVPKTLEDSHKTNLWAPLIRFKYYFKPCIPPCARHEDGC